VGSVDGCCLEILGAVRWFVGVGIMKLCGFKWGFWGYGICMCFLVMICESCAFWEAYRCVCRSYFSVREVWTWVRRPLAVKEY
jgi:hypothetical protein